MKILIDTNVLISAFITESSYCYDVIEHSIHEHELYYTTFVTTEFKRVLKNNLHFAETIINELLKFIEKFFVKGKTAVEIENICKDPNDNQLLADALANNIEVIITGDKDVLDLKNYKGIKIISPKEYWKL